MTHPVPGIDGIRSNWRRLSAGVTRAIAVSALVISAGTIDCSDPIGPSANAEFVAADRDGRDGAGPGLALLNVGGKKYQRVGGPAGQPVWLRDGRRVAYWRINAQFVSQVWIADVESGSDELLISAGGPLIQQKSPHASPDEQWVYVMGCDTDPPLCDFELWRVELSGTRAGQVAQKVPVVPPAGNTAIILKLHDVARDGRLLVEYFTQSLSTGVTRVVLGALEPVTGAITELLVYGESARWSPDGTQIAYVSNLNLYIAALDGGQPRQILPQDLTGYEPGLSWSPDGRFVLARAIGGLHLIDVKRATATPLAFAGSLWEPDWRPR